MLTGALTGCLDRPSRNDLYLTLTLMFCKPTQSIFVITLQAMLEITKPLSSPPDLKQAPVTGFQRLDQGRFTPCCHTERMLAPNLSPEVVCHLDIAGISREFVRFFPCPSLYFLFFAFNREPF